MKETAQNIMSASATQGGRNNRPAKHLQRVQKGTTRTETVVTASCYDYYSTRLNSTENYGRRCLTPLIPRLHDTTGCQTRCTTGLIIGCIM